MEVRSFGCFLFETTDSAGTQMVTRASTYLGGDALRANVRGFPFSVLSTASKLVLLVFCAFTYHN